MKKQFTNEQIIYTLRQVEGGTSVAEVCRGDSASPSRLIIAGKRSSRAWVSLNLRAYANSKTKTKSSRGWSLI